MSSIETADRFLAECVRSSLASAALPPWPQDWQQMSDAELVAARAEFHGVAMLLVRQLGDAKGWPAHLRERLTDEARLAGLWEEMHRTAITRLLAALADAGIETIVMKGTALAYLFYDDPAMRRRGDTDLLIRPADLERTRTIFRANDCFESEGPHGLFYQETWLIDCGAGMLHSIDLHWEPSDRPLLRKILRADRFWQGRVPVTQLSPHAAAPDALMMLVHGAINQSWHLARGYSVKDERVTGGRRLIWAVDYLRLTAGFDDSWTCNGFAPVT